VEINVRSDVRFSQYERHLAEEGMNFHSHVNVLGVDPSGGTAGQVLAAFPQKIFPVTAETVPRRSHSMRRLQESDHSSRRTLPWATPMRFEDGSGYIRRGTRRSSLDSRSPIKGCCSDNARACPPIRDRLDSHPSLRSLAGAGGAAGPRGITVVWVP
jgi:hypothetical protein